MFAEPLPAVQSEAQVFHPGSTFTWDEPTLIWTGNGFPREPSCMKMTSVFWGATSSPTSLMKHTAPATVIFAVVTVSPSHFPLLSARHLHSKPDDSREEGQCGVLCRSRYSRVGARAPTPEEHRTRPLYYAEILPCRKTSVSFPGKQNKPKKRRESRPEHSKREKFIV